MWLLLPSIVETSILLTLCPAGPIEAASNAETSTTQLVQDITIRAQVTMADPSRVRSFEVPLPEIVQF